MESSLCRLAGLVALLLLVLFSAHAVFPASSAALPSPPNVIESVKAGDMASLRLALRGGADPNIRDADGMTALHYAAYRGNMEAAKLLTGARADLNTRDSLGLTPLHAAAFEGRTEMADFLLQKGAAVGTKDSVGNTPLHYAALNDHLEVAEVLLAWDADPQAVNTLGRSPAFIAQALGNQKLMALFENFSPTAAAEQNPASGADKKKVVRTYTNEDLAQLREKSRLVFQEGGASTVQPGEVTSSETGAAPAGGAVDSTEGTSDAYAQIDSLKRERRDIESRLPALQKSCDEFKQREGGSGPASPRLQNSLGTDLYKQYEAVRARDERLACGPFNEAKERLAQIDSQIADLQGTIPAAGTPQPSSGGT